VDTISLLREQFTHAHRFLEATVADVTPEQAQWVPPGTANPLGATYAHIVTSEDMLVNVLLQGGAPLFAITWAGKTGLSERMPIPGPEWEQYGAWARRVQVDLPALHQYAAAIYANTDAYLATLTTEDMDRPIDMTRLGLGAPASLAWVLAQTGVAHLHNICGEIAVLKGIQGAIGYRYAR
jgi:hypothetical protein